MKRLSFICWTALPLLLCAPGAALAQEAPAAPPAAAEADAPVDFSADQLTYDVQNEIVTVSGDVRMTLHAGKATVTGRQSDVSLYDFNLATYDEGDSFDQSQARGFIDIYGMSSKLAARRDAGLL